jgi:hypothetical protein
MAVARGPDLDEDLAVAGPLELDLLGPERLALGIGRRQPLLEHHGRGHPHLRFLRGADRPNPASLTFYLHHLDQFGRQGNPDLRPGGSPSGKAGRRFSSSAANASF